MKKPRLGIVAVLGLVAAAVGLTVAAATAAGKSSAKTPIIIGAAVDLTSSMKPFDSPALAGAKIALDTCDVEYGAAATQEFLNKGLLTIAPCTTTDQMGPQRFGTKGKLAFTVGSTAQDEGSAE